MAATIGAFTYLKAVNGDTTSSGANVTTDQSKFPVCVHILGNGANRNFDVGETTNFFGGWNSSGKRCQFFDSSGANLAYEVEYDNSSSGSEEAVYWVKVPTVTGSAYNNNLSWIAYGNDPDGSNQDQATSVWDNNFKAVYHMGDNSWTSGNGACRDSTSNAKHSTGATGTSDVGGQARRGRDFDGSDDVVVLPNIGLSNGTAYTISGFYKAESNPSAIETIWTEGHSGGTETDVWIALLNDGSLYGEYTSSTGYSQLQDTADTADGAWHHFAFVQVAANNRVLYRDGSQQDRNTTNIGVASPAADTNAIADWSHDGYIEYKFTGSVDEIRLSSASRSADWVKLEYFSLKKTNWNGGARNNNLGLAL